MPIIQSYGDSTEENQTAEIPLTLIRRIRMLWGRSNEPNQTFLTQTGRIRHPRVKRAINDFSAQGFYKRIRMLFGNSTERVKTFLTYVVASPAPIAPTGSVWHNLKPIEETVIIRGCNYDIHYEFVGKKLLHLYACFSIKKLDDTVLIEKGFKLSPGGITVDRTDVIDGKDQIVGTVFLLPHETLDLPEEVKYSVCISDKNRSTRKYFTNFGFMKTVAP